MARRFHVAFAVIVVTALVVVSVGVALARQGQLLRKAESSEAVLKRQECIGEITAKFQAAVGDALLAPPAPNPARTDAVDRIKAAAQRLHHLDRYCP